jgi:hypothetical protein
MYHARERERERNSHSIVFRKPEDKGSLVKPRRRWEDDIKIYLGEIC